MSTLQPNADIHKLRELAFPKHIVGERDIERWVKEGFVFDNEQKKRFVLRQKQGGPCGVIASVQGFILMHLLFEQNRADRGLEEGLQNISEDDARDALVEALVGILWRARNGQNRPVVVCTGDVDNDKIESGEFEKEDDAKEFLTTKLDEYASSGGIMLFVYSLLLTRGLDEVKNDMDDETQGLTGQFGHCTQELMNLLLTGVASSQVHDGTVDIGGGMALRGVQVRPLVGYLTHLEAFRYCQVGMYYKKPKFPIWVIGSESHYTVLFGFDKTVNEESMRTLQLNRAKRAFNEQAQDETGFVAVEKVGLVIQNLGLEMSEEGVANLIAKCEMPGAGIVLWNSFWNEVKPLLVPQLQWNCPACTYLNEGNQDRCAICDNQRRDNIIVGDDGEEGEDDSPRTIDLVHINGLVSTRQGVQQGPTVTKFLLTIVSKDLQAPSTQGHGIAVEEVLHTRWMGSVFLWPNDEPPNING